MLTAPSTCFHDDFGSLLPPLPGLGTTPAERKL